MVDNTELFKEKLLDFDDNQETFYMIKVIARRKMVMESEYKDVYLDVFGSHHEFMLYSKCVFNHKQYDRICKLVKLMCEQNPFCRAYITLDKKSLRKATFQAFSYLNEISEPLWLGVYDYNKTKRLFSLSNHVASVKESSVNRDSNFYLLDVDYNSEHSRSDIDRAIEVLDSLIKRIAKETDLTQLPPKEFKHFKYDTPNGLHYVISKKYASYFKNPKLKEDYECVYSLLVAPYVDEKENALGLLYAPA